MKNESISHAGAPKPNNAAILAWVEEFAALTRPEQIFWCDGSEAQDKSMREAIVASAIGRSGRMPFWCAVS